MAVDIILTVAGQGSGTGGESRQFAYSLIDPTPPLVTLSLDDVTGVTSYLWEILNQPISATASLSSQSAASPTFTPTATYWGTYLIRCVITRNGSQEVGTVALSFRTPNRDMRFPAAGEKTEFTSINGWMEAEYTLYDIVDNLAIGSGSGTTGAIGYWTRSSTYLSPVNSGDRLRVGSGELTRPSYAYEADIDTGRYLFNTGVEAFACSGNAQIIWGSDGNPYMKAVDGHNRLTIGNYKTIGGGEAELLLEADGDTATDGAILNLNAKSTAGKESTLSILSDSDNGTTNLNITSNAGDTGTASNIDILAHGGDATINISTTTAGANGTEINIDSQDVFIHSSETISLTSGTNKASIVIEPPTIPNPNGEIRFSDNYIYNYWSNRYMTWSDSSTEDATFTSNFGQVSLFAALNYLYSASGSVTWDDVYDFGGSGAGRSSTVDNGAWTATVPASSTNSAMSLSNLESTNTSEVLSIYNDATLSTGYALYFQGDTGGDSDDYDEFGHRIWTPGSLSIGHGDVTSGANNSRSYTRYDYYYDAAYGGGRASAMLRADLGASWADYAYFSVYSDSAGGSAETVATYRIIFADGYTSSSTWPSNNIPLGVSVAEWTALDSLIDAQGTNHSIIGGILAAASGGGGSPAEPDKQIVYGTTASIDSNAHFTFDDDYDQVRIINNHNETNWYDANAASLLLQGTATQGNSLVANGNLNVGTVHSTINNKLLLSSRNTDGTSTYYPSIEILAEATNNSIAGHGIVLNAKESSNDYTLTITPDSAEIAGMPLVLENVNYGTIGSASFSTDTITVDFSTGKDFQAVNITANADNLVITPPVAAAKGLTLAIYSSGTRTIGAGTGWDGILWELNGPQLATTTITNDAGTLTILTFAYDGIGWVGWVSEFSGPGA